MNNSKQLVLATGNKSKLEEFKSLLEGYDVISIPVETKEIQGTSEEIIIEKAKQTYKVLNRRCIVEDTSFGFVEWNGLPGPYIKDFVKLIGLENLSKITKNKRAKIICLVALANSSEDIFVFRGESAGEVVGVGGNNGFDFDKFFIPDGHTVRFSEMTREEKNKISHRFKAITKLKEYLEKERV
ncbi:MAG: non-canonical purine NTP pyrophosphatase [Candidatus Nanoarchaeia archaeon]